MDLGPIFIDHIGIATNNLDEGSTFWKLIGLNQAEHDELNEEQGVNIRFFSTSKPDSQQDPPRIEILEPTGSKTPIGKFLEKRGPGVQQVCLRVEQIERVIEYLILNEIIMIDKVPKIGAGGSKIAFVHPKSTGGVLVELTEHVP